MIGHASKDERGGAINGAAGDQTGQEVYTRTWYNGNWNVVLRAIEAKVREAMAAACEVLCRGNLVGYDLYERNALWDELERVGWDPTKLKAKTETDCSAFITALAKIAGIDVQRVPMGGGKYNAPVTQTMRAAFSNTGKFQVLTESKYLTSDKYLLRGDILLRESGHTAINLTTGSLAIATASATGAATVATAKTSASTTGKLQVSLYRDQDLQGAYRVTASELNLRLGAGTENAIIATTRRGDIVYCEGYYNLSNKEQWLLIWFQDGQKTVTAYAKGTYLEKL